MTLSHRFHGLKTALVLQESHREQLQQLTQRHRQETEETLAKLQREMDRKNEQIQQTQRDYDHQIATLQEQVRACPHNHHEFVSDLSFLLASLQLGQTQKALSTLTKTLHAREHVRSEQLTQLDHQLQAALRVQFDAVSRVANELSSTAKVCHR